MQMKHGSITLFLIQLFVISTIVGASSPIVSATQNDANATPSNVDFPNVPAGEDVDFDMFDTATSFKPEFVPGQVLVKFRTGISLASANGIVTTGVASVDELNKRFEIREIEKVFLNVYKLTLPQDANVLSVAKHYEADPNVEYTESNGIYRTFLVPNDPNYTQQWAHQMIESEYAWNTTTGDSNVIVAIVDTGVDWNHPDLVANMWNNTDEIPDNGIDDDENGFIDDIRGWDFVNASGFEYYPEEDYTDPDNDPMDFTGHGTLCAGIVSAVGNNEIGVAGVTWNCKIMAVRSGFGFPPGGILMWDQAAAGISYATDNGADIISMSFGGTYRSKVMYDAIKYAYDNGVLLVAAAGNSMTNIKTYPAAHEEVVTVTATDQNDYPAWFTNFGSWAEVAAPGENILSTICPNAILGPYKLEYPYDYGGGTSAATPHVAGVAASIWSRFPSMTRDQVRYQLRRTAVDKAPPGFDVYYGHGRINASGAVNQDIPDHDLLVWSWKLPFVSEPSDTVTVETTVLNFGESTEGNFYVKLLVNGTEEDSKKITALQGGESVSVSCSWTPETEGKYNVTTYVVPVKGENIVANNVQSAYSWARYGEAVKIPNDFPTIQEAIETTNLEFYGGDATIQVSNGTHYVPTECFIIQNMLASLTLAGENASTTIIDGYVLSPTYGVYVHSDNVTITGFTIQNCGFAVTLSSNDNVVRDNNLTANSEGIQIHAYSGNTIINNTLSNNGHGLTAVSGSNEAIISGNTIADNFYGVGLYGSTNYVLANNILTGNTRSFIVSGPSLPNFIHDIDTSNTVDGNPILYLINQSDLVVDPSTFPNIGYLGLVNSTNITVKNLALSNNAQGVLFAYTTDSIIQNSTFLNDHWGIFLSGSNNTIINNNTFTDSAYGIYTVTSSNNTLLKNLMLNNNAPIFLENSSGNNVSDNEISNGTSSIHLWNSCGNTVNGNIISNNDYGIRLSSSSNNSFCGNLLNNNTYSFYFDGDQLPHYVNSIDVSNLVDGKPVYYLVNQKDLIINPTTYPQVGYLALINSTNVTVEGLTLENNWQGVLLAYTNNSRIAINATNTYYGVYLSSSSNNSICGNNVTGNSCGVYLSSSSNNSICGNNVTGHTQGVYLSSSSNNSICGNNVTGNSYGIISVESSYYNSICGNNVTGNSYGVYLGKQFPFQESSESNFIIDNRLQYNTYGIYISHSDNNIVHHNNFITNTYQAYTIESYNNAWNSTNRVGNYWSDYNGTDIDEDGIGEPPYFIGENDQDDYPLMWKWFPGDLDGDGDVDPFDFAIFRVAQGSQMGDPNYNRLADLDYDCDVDDDDYAIFLQNYGKSYP